MFASRTDKASGEPLPTRGRVPDNSSVAGRSPDGRGRDLAYGTDGLRTGAALRVAPLTDANSRARQSAPMDAVMFGFTPVRRPSPGRSGRSR